jgi:hypothetical protein
MLKGWLDRVWTPGFAYDLSAEGWRGDISGRQPKRPRRIVGHALNSFLELVRIQWFESVRRQSPDKIV